MGKIAFNRVVFFVSVLLLAVVVPLVYADRAGADSALALAEQELTVCFESTVKAEALGANVSSLSEVLNDAGSLLSRAKVAYSQGSFDLARDLAVQCQSSLAGFLAERNALVVSSAAKQTNELLISVAGATAATVIIVVVGWAVWGFLEKQHFREILGSKPVLEE